jgi:preprotein translocase subunit YajC
MGNSPYSTLVLIALMVVAFYFLIIRPNKKRQQAQLQTMNSLTPGTRVLLTSGVFGTLVEVGQKQAVVELSPGVHLTVLKQAIARAVREGDEDSPLDEDELLDDPAILADDDPRDDAGPLVDSDLPTGDETHHEVTRPFTPGTTGSTESASGYRADGYSRSSDSDPRPGTNTSPTKD